MARIYQRRAKMISVEKRRAQLAVQTQGHCSHRLAWLLEWGARCPYCCRYGAHLELLQIAMRAVVEIELPGSLDERVELDERIRLADLLHLCTVQPRELGPQLLEILERQSPRVRLLCLRASGQASLPEGFGMKIGDDDDDEMGSRNTPTCLLGILYYKDTKLALSWSLGSLMGGECRDFVSRASLVGGLTRVM